MQWPFLFNVNLKDQQFVLYINFNFTYKKDDDNMSDIDGFPTDFCPICGGLIDLDTLDDHITCHVCKNRLPFE